MVTVKEPQLRFAIHLYPTHNGTMAAIAGYQPNCLKAADLIHPVQCKTGTDYRACRHGNDLRQAFYLGSTIR